MGDIVFPAEKKGAGFAGGQAQRRHKGSGG